MFIWYYFSLSFWCIPFLLDSSSIFINRQRHIKNVQILSQISCNFYIFFSNCLTSFYCIILCYALLTKDFRSFYSVSEIFNFVFLEREIFWELYSPPLVKYFTYLTCIYTNVLMLFYFVLSKLSCCIMRHVWDS